MSSTVPAGGDPGHDDSDPSRDLGKVPPGQGKFYQRINGGLQLVSILLEVVDQVHDLGGGGETALVVLQILRCGLALAHRATARLASKRRRRS